MSNADKKAEVERLTRLLAQPFEPSEVKFKPAVVKNNQAMALAYVDARVIQDRLDDVLGVENWQTEYHALENGSVMCKLSIRLGGEWLTKADVGGPSEQPDEGDRLKAAFSDALKRAAVAYGIGRYLYRFKSQWVAYDQQKRKFSEDPKIPESAMPRKDSEDSALLRAEFEAKLKMPKTAGGVKDLGILIGEKNHRLTNEDKAALQEDYKAAIARVSPKPATAKKEPAHA